jgi:radial spoke head protein 9
MSFPYLPLDLFALRGKTLSVAEATAIQASLTVLSSKTKSRVRFWGKILGYHGDYHLAEVLTDGTFGPRNAFYSVDGGVNWLPLPTLTSDQAEFCEQLRGRFIGQPDYLYKIRRDVPPEPEAAPELPADEDKGEEEEEQEAEDAVEEKEEGDDVQLEAVPEDEAAEEEKAPKKTKPKFQVISMPESCRIAHFVAVHNANCLLVPRGSHVLKLPARTMVKNRTFSGLTVDEAQKLSSFVHVRAQPLDDVTANKATYGPTFHTTTDFLPPITEDRPEGVWSLQYDATVGAVSLENLLFEGSIFFHKLATPEYDQVYIGTGERNLDLCFVLP